MPTMTLEEAGQKLTGTLTRSSGMNGWPHTNSWWYFVGLDENPEEPGLVIFSPTRKQAMEIIKLAGAVFEGYPVTGKALGVRPLLRVPAAPPVLIGFLPFDANPGGFSVRVTPRTMGWTRLAIEDACGDIKVGITGWETHNGPKISEDDTSITLSVQFEQDQKVSAVFSILNKVRERLAG